MNANWWSYLLLLVGKTIEVALITLRLIVVAGGRKTMGSILMIIISVLWVYLTSSVVQGIGEDPLKIVFFAIGSGIGSYIGSYIEEKMAFGNSIVTAIVEEDLGFPIATRLRNQGYFVTIFKSKTKDQIKRVLHIVCKRKEKNKVIKVIHSIDTSSIITSEAASDVFMKE